MASTVRKVGAAGVALGLCLGIAGTIPASALFLSEDTPGPQANPVEVPAVGGLVGLLDAGLLDGLVGGLVGGEGGLFGPEGGVVAGDDTVGEVVDAFAAEANAPTEIVGAVTEVLASPNIGGEGSFGDPAVGGGPLGLGGLLGGLLGGAGGLLGGVF